MTINITTGQEYTGQNAEALEGFEAVCTFKQGIKHYGVSGKQVAGLKAVARLVRFRMLRMKKATLKSSLCISQSLMPMTLRLEPKLRKRWRNGNQRHIWN